MGAPSWVCPSEPPGYYLPILHAIGIFSVPINFLCLYLVWFHTPKDSKFRYCLAYVQVVAFLVEVDMSWVCPGYYLFPMLGGYNMAVTNRIFTGHQNVVFGSFKFCFELPSLLICFIYRHDAAADLDQKFKMRPALKYLVVITCHTFPFVTALCLLNSQLSSDQQRAIIQKDWPNCVHVLAHQGFVIYDPSGNLWTTAVGLSAMAYISVFSLFGAYIGLRTIYILQKMRIHLSRQTYAMHKTAMINLAMQCIVPSVFVILPFNFIFLVVLHDWYEYQEYATNTFFIMASHSMVSSLVLILSNRRFRSLITERLFRIRNKVLGPLAPYSLEPTNQVAPTTIQLQSSPL